MTPSELFSLPSAVPVYDVERAKLLYLAQFAHRDCGGAPVAYLRDDAIGCTGCGLTVPGRAAPLGRMLAASGVFVSLVVKEDA